LIVLAVQGAVHAMAFSAPACRLAALTSVIVANLGLLVWFRADRAEHRQHAQPTRPPSRDARRHTPPWTRHFRWRPALHAPGSNRVFGWLLVGLAAAYGAVLVVTPLTQQFGFPVLPEVRLMGWVLLGAAALGGLWCAKAAARDVSPAASNRKNV
jgi:hypothetical protein